MAVDACGAETGLISIDQALQEVLTHTQALGSEKLSLSQAYNRYLTEDIYSKIELPLFSQSAVDGYAICANRDLQQGTTFELIGEIRAGQKVNFTLNEGQAVRIFTGTKIPFGTTTIARQEIVKLLEDQLIQLSSDLKLHEDIRKQGEEIGIGQCLAEKGQQLTVGAIAALSMAGVQQVSVSCYPKIAVVITGDEVAKSIEDFQEGKIFDANAPLLEAWFAEQGQQIKIYHVTDDISAVKTLLTDLSQSHDVVLSTGGVSVGAYDFIRPVALQIGFEQIFWKVKQKPGKPMLFAKLQRPDQSYCYLMGLPGNPAAVYVGAQIYLKTLLRCLQGKKHLPQWFSAQMAHPVKPDHRERFVRMSAEFKDGYLQVKSLGKQQSHMLSNLMLANCLVRLPAAQEIVEGQIVSGIFIDTPFV